VCERESGKVKEIERREGGRKREGDGLESFLDERSRNFCRIF